MFGVGALIRMIRMARPLPCRAPPVWRSRFACRVSMIMNAGYHNPTQRRGLEKQDWTVASVRTPFLPIIRMKTRLARVCSTVSVPEAPDFVTSGGALSLPARSRRTSSGSPIRTGSPALICHHLPSSITLQSPPAPPYAKHTHTRARTRTRTHSHTLSLSFLAPAHTSTHTYNGTRTPQRIPSDPVPSSLPPRAHVPGV